MAKHHDTGLKPPRPPQAVRLNRLAAVLAAGCVGATLLTVGLMVSSEHESDIEAQREREEARFRSRGPARPDFLERPLEEEIAGEEVASEEVAGANALSPTSPAVAGTHDADPAAYVPPAPYGASAYYEASDGGAASGPSPEEEALERALRSSLTPPDVRPVAPDEARPAYGSGTGYDAGNYDANRYLRALSALSSTYSTGGMRQGDGPPLDTEPVASEAAGRPYTFSEAAARLGRGGADSGRVRAASETPRHTSHYRSVSPYELREGTVIEAQLLTAIHSDLPGEVLAQVARNVYDSQTQQVLLIPRGTRLVGTYDSQIALGQGRLFVAWTRMVLPDGRSLTLSGLASKDLRGQAGLTGRVDRHRLGMFGDALMLSVVGAGLALSQRGPDRGGSAWDGSAYPSPGEIMAGSVAAELARVATETLRARAGRSPTIQIREGAAFYVFLSGDLALPPYHTQGGPLDRSVDGSVRVAEWP